MRSSRRGRTAHVRARAKAPRGAEPKGRVEPHPHSDLGAQGRGSTATYSLEVAVSSLIFSSPRSDRHTEQHRRSQSAARTHQKLHHCYPLSAAPGQGTGRAVSKGGGGGGKEQESGLYPENPKS